MQSIETNSSRHNRAARSETCSGTKAPRSRVQAPWCLPWRRTKTRSEHSSTTSPKWWRILIGSLKNRSRSWPCTSRPKSSSNKRDDWANNKITHKASALEPKGATQVSVAMAENSQVDPINSAPSRQMTRINGGMQLPRNKGPFRLAISTTVKLRRIKVKIMVTSLICLRLQEWPNRKWLMRIVTFFKSLQTLGAEAQWLFPKQVSIWKGTKTIIRIGTIPWIQQVVCLSMARVEIEASKT